MKLTIGNWVILGCVAAICIVVTIMVCSLAESWKATIISALVGVAILGGIVAVMSWYNTKNAQGIRNYKDYQSEMSGGIDREIIITAEDGREIFRYEGKIDIESDHTDNYIKFESEEGKRYLIYYGIQDTITIIEK